ncbi:unnamed protein product [Urochloa decumbens]|uniref:DUF6598 domain-containing protein n=2 Tax=Urochloa decumbens TaxID=240449 RepID=A0ABC9AB89_9POAL
MSGFESDPIPCVEMATPGFVDKRRMRKTMTKEASKEKNGGFELDLIACVKMAATLGFADKGMKKTLTKEASREDEKIVSFRRHWENCYGKDFGSFEDTTVVPPMRYTFGSIPTSATLEEGLQIFSIKVTQLKEEEGLLWPLHVYGLIAIRDSIDPRRNLLFHRARDNCQTITKEDPFLLLTGPSHAVVIIDPVSFEVQLKAKGESESEDKVLVFDVLTSQHAVSHMGAMGHPPPVNLSYLLGKRVSLGFAFAVLPRTVEATISVEVVHNSWPENIPVLITACTASLPQVKIVLLDSKSEKVPINDSGVIMLSRHAVSVELSGKLKVEVQAVYHGELIKGYVRFTPKKATISYQRCSTFFCTLGITVGWSLFNESLDSDADDLL